MIINPKQGDNDTKTQGILRVKESEKNLDGTTGKPILKRKNDEYFILFSQNSYIFFPFDRRKGV